MKIFLSAVFLVCLIYPGLHSQTFGELNCDLAAKAKFKKGKLTVCKKTLDVEIADNDILRAIGLMCRDSMPKNNGMIFMFQEERTLSFWMKNTRIPLSIGYFNKNKELMDIYDMEPMLENKFYASKKPAQYALETNQGWFKNNKVKPGCKFDLVNLPE